MNQSADDFALPTLRHDLQLIEGPVSLDGSPTWIIVDHIRNKYFSIGWTAFQLLSKWSLGKASLLIKKVREETTLDVSNEDVQSLLAFLYVNSLTLESVSGSSNDYYEQYKASKPNFLIWLIHNYLFIKIPLVKPTNFLRRTLVYVEPMFSRTTVSFVVLMGVIGLYIVGRQWEEFTSTFLYFFNLQGMGFYFLSLVFIKILHELAHAYTVVRYGSKVPTMGIAFLVMFPLLYTDTSDTWRVKSARERMHVGAAGMIMELYIACIATFCWGFLPDGVLKSAAFILATTSWIMSLLINSNILMRFDGYYIFSDLLGIQNLQKRSFEIGKWKLTEVLFNTRLKPPEALPKSMIRKLYIYAWSVWVYRLFLFIGIAVLVYYFFFKVLGIILFIIEILWFIVIPVIGMFRYWWDMKMRILKSLRFYISVSIFCGLLALFFIPWNTTINIPAVFLSQSKVTLFSPTPAYIENSFLKKGLRVNEDDVLLTLRSPQLEHEIDITHQEIELLRLQAKRIAASSEDLSNVQIIVQQLQEARSKLNGLEERRDKLIIRAPINGVVLDLEESLQNGRWINEELAIATIVQPEAPSIEAVATEFDLPRIDMQATSKFIPDNPQLPPIWGFVTDIEQANLTALDLTVLGSTFGGKVAVEPNKSGQLIPEKSVYRIRINISEVENVTSNQLLRGVVHIQGETESYFSRLYGLVVSVLIRESGF